MILSFFFFFNDPATTEIYTYLHTLPLHDALPICPGPAPREADMAAPAFHGIYPMLYALFGPDGALDRAAHVAQVEACIAAGVHGLAVGGLASECNKLTVAERRDLAEWTLVAAAGRVPVSVTVSDNTVGGQVEAVRHAADLGAAWAVLQPPTVKSASEAALIDFFGADADAAPIRSASRMRRNTSASDCPIPGWSS